MDGTIIMLSLLQLLFLKAELDSAHQRYLELKMCSDEEIQSLKHQLQTVQKVRCHNNVT